MLAAVTIYTDGACSGNGTANARGGWAALLARDDGVGGPRELSGGEKPSTNQRMEIRAAIEGLKALKKPCRVTLYSDSAYVIRCMNDRWYDKWRRNSWKSSKREPVANRDLWEELLALVEDAGHEVCFVKVAGHADKLKRASSEAERFNQRVDALAVAAVPPAA